MDLKLKNQEIYKLSYNYLFEIKPAKLQNSDLEKYFVGDRKDYKSLEDVFEQLISSAQNYQRMPNVIKFKERYSEIKEILFDYDFEKIIECSVDDLYYKFRNEFNVVSADSNKNSWRKWSKSIISSAKFINEFESVENFKEFVSLFKFNLHTRMALPLLLQTKISGIGFALACDCLKELGYIDYPKPDVHLNEVFNEFGLSENEPIQVFEAIVRMSEDCKEIDEAITPYKIDKIIWLICSGKYYLDDISVGRNKDKFINYVKSELEL